MPMYLKQLADCAFLEGHSQGGNFLASVKERAVGLTFRVPSLQNSLLGWPVEDPPQGPRVCVVDVDVAVCSLKHLLTQGHDHLEVAQ